MKRFFSLVLVFITIVNLSVFTKAKTPDKKMSGVWLCSVGNLDFPSKKGLDESALKSELDSVISHCKSNGINTIFFQVRPNSDALYKSNVFPWSEVISGQQGKAPDNDFDPLLYIVQKAHSAAIELHAWINPYRIGNKNSLSEIL